MKSIIAVSFLVAFYSTTSWSEELKVLFIGNSFTYLPTIGKPEDPALPKMVKSIVNSIHPALNITTYAYTVGGYSLEKHFKDPKSYALMKGTYDKVILQGSSIEPLELPLNWKKIGLGVQSFSVYLPKVLDLLFKNNKEITLYVYWGWNHKNNQLQKGHPGLTFPMASPRGGQKWCGNNKFELQQMINKSYAKHARGYDVNFAMVGDAWIDLQNARIVTQDEFYIPNDWIHASKLGAYVSALVLVRDSLGLDISKNTFIPEGIESKRALEIQKFLSLKE